MGQKLVLHVFGLTDAIHAELEGYEPPVNAPSTIEQTATALLCVMHEWSHSGSSAYKSSAIPLSTSTETEWPQGGRDTLGLWALVIS